MSYRMQPMDSQVIRLKKYIEGKIVLKVMTVEDYVLMIQHSERELKALIKIKQKPKEDRTISEVRDVSNYELMKGRLMRKVQQGEEERWLYVVPKNLRKSIAIKYHDLMAHFGVDRTVARIRHLYWFAMMRNYIKKHIAPCVECLLSKIPNGKQPGELHPIPPPRRPFSRIHCDYMGPLVTSGRGYKYVLVVVDVLTKFVKLYLNGDTKTASVVRSLNKFISQYGIPDRIVCDRGTCFTSDSFRKFATEKGIRGTLTFTHWAQANGQCERVNRTLFPTVMTATENEEDWASRIEVTGRNMHTAVNKTTGKAPYEVF